MVFKGRFFSSKKCSDSSANNSPDGSNNSPRLIGTNSPLRSDKKKSKSSPKDNPQLSSGSSFWQTTTKVNKDGTKKKDAKGKESQDQSNPVLYSVPKMPSTATAVAADVKDVQLSPSSVSPILASSLGLNKIKTRSGPLPQENFFGFRSEKGSAPGTSNLSRPGCSGNGRGGSSDLSSGVKKEMGGQSRLALLGSGMCGNLVDNVSNSDSVSISSARSTNQSPNVVAQSQMQNGSESSSETGQYESSRDPPKGLRSSDVCTPEMPYDCDNPKESESPRFQALLRLTSAPRKRFPADVKSFSHELNSKGLRPFLFWKPRGLNNLEEILVVIRAKFDKAKEEVNSDLAIFAANLVEILEKNADNHPEWQETIEDFLVLARRCAMSSTDEFWLQCEGIVQELDDRRQEFPPGMLKQLHTRMLFILTRCTRLLQFHKESGLADDEHVLQLRQSRILQSTDKHNALGLGRDVKSSSAARASKAASARKSYSQEQHNHTLQPGNVLSSQADDPLKNQESPSNRNRMASWKKFPSPVGKTMKEITPLKGQSDGKVEHLKAASNRRGTSDVDLTAKPSEPQAKDSHKHSSKHHHKVSWGYWGDQPNISDESSIICRICEEEVPTLNVEDHSIICTIADRCDQKGSVNERLARIAETLEKMIQSMGQKDIQHMVGSPDVAKVSNTSVTEESDAISPKHSDWSRRGSEDMLDCFLEADNYAFMDDLKGLPSMLCKTRFGPKSDQGMATSSAGSMTPRSPIFTPRTSEIDMLLAGRVLSLSKMMYLCYTADWWSVGVILFELIVGIPPFNAEHPQMIFDNILNRKVPWPRVPEEMSPEAQDLIDCLLIEDPNQRLGARGASEVKQHVFFKDINWGTLARQKAAFVPSSESMLDTSYFTSRYLWNASDGNFYQQSEAEDSSDGDSISGSSSCQSNRHDEVNSSHFGNNYKQGDECGGLAEFELGSSVNYSFSNFSFKNLSQLASINYDLLSKGWKDDPPTNSNA